MVFIVLIFKTLFFIGNLSREGKSIKQTLFAIFDILYSQESCRTPNRSAQVTILYFAMFMAGCFL